jgi:hypothetical protein
MIVSGGCYLFEMCSLIFSAEPYMMFFAFAQCIPSHFGGATTLGPSIQLSVPSLSRP